MKKLIMLLSIAGLFLTNINAEEMKKQKMRYQAVNPAEATLLQDGKSKNFCLICGMTLPMFYKTNHAAKDGETMKQYCSIHCLIEDKIVNKSDLKELLVVDNTSKKFIKVEEAFYVVGSSKPATMAMVSKYAFAKKEDAINFAKQNGGEIKNFDVVSEIVAQSLEKEKNMIAKKQAKMQKMGGKIYSKMCKKTDTLFDSTASAKAYVTSNKLCGELKGKKLQAVGIFLARR